MGKILSAFVTVTNTPIINIVKQTDETIDSSTVLHDDTELKGLLPLPNHTYQFKLTLMSNSGSTPDLKVAFAIPSGSALFQVETGGINFNEDLSDATVPKKVEATVASGVCVINGFITITTKGDLIFQWAQNTSDAGNTTVLAGSRLAVWQ